MSLLYFFIGSHAFVFIPGTKAFPQSLREMVSNILARSIWPHHAREYFGVLYEYFPLVRQGKYKLTRMILVLEWQVWCWESQGQSLQVFLKIPDYFPIPRAVLSTKVLYSQRLPIWTTELGQGMQTSEESKACNEEYNLLSTPSF